MSQIVFEALQFASRCHRGSYRKGTAIPYIVHPVSMVRYLSRLDAAEELVAAAALHDVVEDTEATLEDIRQHFGPRIASLVEGASEADKSLSWRARKLATIESAKKSKDLELAVLKCVDKLDNLSDIREDLALRGDSVWERFNADKVELAWYYQTLAGLFAEKLAGTDFEALARELVELCREVFAEVQAVGVLNGAKQ